MNKNLLALYSLVIVCVLGADVANAQNYANKFGVEINGGFNEYGGDRGRRYFNMEKEDYQGVGGSFGYYITPSFDGILFGAVGDLGHRDDSYPIKLGFRARITYVELGLRYKFANGYILKETSKIKPYLYAGWGGLNSVSHIITDQPGYPSHTVNRTWTAAHWSAGGGVRYAITDHFDVLIQSTFNYTFDDNYDGLPFSTGRLRLNANHDAFLYHSIGFAYNFGENEGAYRFSGTDEEVPKELVERVNLAARSIQFETGSSTISQESYAELDTIANILLNYPALQTLIEGHTDDVGDDDSNMELSQKRADAVKKYLADKGVSESRMSAKGYGETQPKKKNNSDENRAINRRVEVKLYYKN